MIRISFGKGKGKTWKKPYLKCLSHKTLLKYYKEVSNLGQKWQNKHPKKQKLTDFWDDKCGRPNYRNRHQMRYTDENRTGDKGMDMVEGIVMETKISRKGAMGGLLLKSKHATPLQREGSPIEIHHLEELVVDREMVMGMVRITMIKIEEDIEILNMTFKRRMRKRVILKILLNLKLLHSN